jgi:hypothetical protein
METLVARSDEYAHLLHTNVGDALQALYENSPRLELAANAALLSLEHAYTLRLAIAHGAPSSATGLMRLQYEAVVRGAWLLYAATEVEIVALSAKLDEKVEIATAARGQSHLPVSSKTSKPSFSKPNPQWFVLADGQATDGRSDNDSDPARR